MTRAYVCSEVRDIIRGQLNLEDTDFKDEQTFKDLGADSLDAAEMVIEIEERFEISIPDPDAENLLTVASTIDYVCKKLGIAEED